MAEWVSLRTIMLHCATNLTDWGLNPRADMVNQAIQPSGVGKLVAISVQWVTIVESCKGESVWLYNGWRAAYAAGGANYLTLVFCSLHARP
jgi:hypothetical protein